MAKKIYVGNMNYNTSEDTLRQLFAQYGEVVSVNVITDRYTGPREGLRLRGNGDRRRREGCNDRAERPRTSTAGS